MAQVYGSVGSGLRTYSTKAEMEQMQREAAPNACRMTESATPDRPAFSDGTVRERLAALERATYALGDSLALLQDTLAPLVSPLESSGNAVGVPAPARPMCAVASTIDEIVGRLSLYQQRVVGLVQAVDL